MPARWPISPSSCRRRSLRRRRSARRWTRSPARNAIHSAIAEFSTALQAAGYRREASTALVSFSLSCGGDTTSLTSAVNILLGLSDYLAARGIADMVVKQAPFSDNGYFLRAFASDKLNDNKAAIDDYADGHRTLRRQDPHQQYLGRL